MYGPTKCIFIQSLSTSKALSYMRCKNTKNDLYEQRKRPNNAPITHFSSTTLTNSIFYEFLYKAKELFPENKAKQHIFLLNKV